MRLRATPLCVMVTAAVSLRLSSITAMTAYLPGTRPALYLPALSMLPPVADQRTIVVTEALLRNAVLIAVKSSSAPLDRVAVVGDVELDAPLVPAPGALERGEIVAR